MLRIKIETRNPARKVVQMIMDRKAADELITAHFGAMIKALFYGYQDHIKESPLVQQTTYGKRTTHKEDLPVNDLEGFGAPSLERLLHDKFVFIAHQKECREYGVTNTVRPPPSQ
ncbi:hypothetical protein BGZ72_004329 [Mortierella alpina]|nr:hypothetical protein BGZ72_004329 [Mortierella alpina]